MASESSPIVFFKFWFIFQYLSGQNGHPGQIVLYHVVEDTRIVLVSVIMKRIPKISTNRDAINQVQNFTTQRPGSVHWKALISSVLVS